MASTQTWSEFNGSGSTETGSRTEINFKNIDDSTTTYSSSPVTAGNNSYGKYQCLKFAGTYNTLSALTYKVSSAAPATGLSIVGAVVSTYTQPSTSATGDGAFSTTGASANFNTGSTPFGAGTSTASANPVYAQAFRAQLQTTSSASPGDTPSVTFTAQWTES